MIEYYLKNSKNTRKDVLALLKELKNYFLIEGISIEKTNIYSNLELKKIEMKASRIHSLIYLQGVVV